LAKFKAVVVDKDNEGQHVTLRDFDDTDLMDGDVTVRLTHSTLNYKDGLALTGRGPVVRRFPMIPGIDFVGTVEHSLCADFVPGDRVLLNGWGTGETHLGAFAEKSRVKGQWLMHLPDGLSPAQAMAIGTAGYTAMLAVMALDERGLRPANGPAVVTGAAGGVGSMAIQLLARAGWHVVAVTGRVGEADYLKALGAAEIVDRTELAGTVRPLAKARWLAGVDSAGSNALANLLSMTQYGGAIAACGLAGGMDLPSSVAPFILRGVALLGVDSVMAPMVRRKQAWQRLASEVDAEKLSLMSKTITLDQVIRAGHDIVDGRIRGRLVVELS
jgi:acrylyl-CoA reductase (NADPH)